MSIATVVTGGFGAFGSVNLIPTLGFSVGIVIVPNIEGLEYTMPSSKGHYSFDDKKAHYAMPNSKAHYKFKDSG